MAENAQLELCLWAVTFTATGPSFKLVLSDSSILFALTSERPAIRQLINSEYFAYFA